MFFKSLFPSVGMQNKLVQIEKETPNQNNLLGEESMIKLMLQEQEQRKAQSLNQEKSKLTQTSSFKKIAVTQQDYDQYNEQTLTGVVNQSAKQMTQQPLLTKKKKQIIPPINISQFSNKQCFQPITASLSNISMQDIRDDTYDDRQYSSQQAQFQILTVSSSQRKNQQEQQQQYNSCNYQNLQKISELVQQSNVIEGCHACSENNNTFVQGSSKHTCSQCQRKNRIKAGKRQSELNTVKKILPAINYHPHKHKKSSLDDLQPMQGDGFYHPVNGGGILVNSARQTNSMSSADFRQISPRLGGAIAPSPKYAIQQFKANQQQQQYIKQCNSIGSIKDIPINNNTELQNVERKNKIQQKKKLKKSGFQLNHNDAPRSMQSTGNNQEISKVIKIANNQLQSYNKTIKRICEDQDNKSRNSSCKTPPVSKGQQQHLYSYLPRQITHVQIKKIPTKNQVQSCHSPLTELVSISPKIQQNADSSGQYQFIDDSLQFYPQQELQQQKQTDPRYNQNNMMEELSEGDIQIFDQYVNKTLSSIERGEPDDLLCENDQLILTQSLEQDEEQQEQLQIDPNVKIFNQNMYYQDQIHQQYEQLKQNHAIHISGEEEEDDGSVIFPQYNRNHRQQEDITKATTSLLDDRTRQDYTSPMETNNYFKSSHGSGSRNDQIILSSEAINIPKGHEHSQAPKIFNTYSGGIAQFDNEQENLIASPQVNKDEEKFISAYTSSSSSQYVGKPQEAVKNSDKKKAVIVPKLPLGLPPKGKKTTDPSKQKINSEDRPKQCQFSRVSSVINDQKNSLDREKLKRQILLWRQKQIQTIQSTKQLKSLEKAFIKHKEQQRQIMKNQIEFSRMVKSIQQQKRSLHNHLKSKVNRSNNSLSQNAFSVCVSARQQRTSTPLSINTPDSCKKSQKLAENSINLTKFKSALMSKLCENNKKKFVQERQKLLNNLGLTVGTIRNTKSNIDDLDTEIFSNTKNKEKLDHLIKSTVPRTMNRDNNNNSGSTYNFHHNHHHRNSNLKTSHKNQIHILKKLQAKRPSAFLHLDKNNSEYLNSIKYNSKILQSNKQKGSFTHPKQLLSRSIPLQMNNNINSTCHKNKTQENQLSPQINQDIISPLKRWQIVENVDIHNNNNSNTQLQTFQQTKSNNTRFLSKTQSSVILKRQKSQEKLKQIVRSSFQPPQKSKVTLHRSPLSNKSVLNKKKNSKFRLFETVRSSLSAFPNNNNNNNNTLFGNQTCNNLSTTDMTTPSPYPHSKNTITSLVNSSAQAVVVVDAIKQKRLQKSRNKKIAEYRRTPEDWSNQIEEIAKTQIQKRQYDIMKLMLGGDEKHEKLDSFRFRASTPTIKSYRGDFQRTKKLRPEQERIIFSQCNKSASEHKLQPVEELDKIKKQEIDSLIDLQVIDLLQEEFQRRCGFTTDDQKTLMQFWRDMYSKPKKKQTKKVQTGKKEQQKVAVKKVKKKKDGTKFYNHRHLINKIKDPLQKRFELLNIFSEEDIARALKRKFEQGLRVDRQLMFNNKRAERNLITPTLTNEFQI